MKMPWICLYGDECDGYRQKVSFLERPDIYYAVPLLDMEDIKAIKDPKSKEAAFKDRARLAYTFWEMVATEEDIEYRYQRAEDKSLDLPPRTEIADL